MEVTTYETTSYETIMREIPEEAGLSKDEARDFEVHETTKALFAEGIISEENYQEARRFLSTLANQISAHQL